MVAVFLALVAKMETPLVLPPRTFPAMLNLTAELSKKVINMKELRSLALQGFPDSPGILSSAWKLLLGYLLPERSLWSTELKQKRSQYKHYKEELLMSPLEITSKMVGSKALDNYEFKSESGCMLTRSRLNDEDHPSIKPRGGEYLEYILSGYGDHRTDRQRCQAYTSRHTLFL